MWGNQVGGRAVVQREGERGSDGLAKQRWQKDLALTIGIVGEGGRSVKYHRELGFATRWCHRSSLGSWGEQLEEVQGTGKTVQRFRLQNLEQEGVILSRNPM